MKKVRLTIRALQSLYYFIYERNPENEDQAQE